MRKFAFKLFFFIIIIITVLGIYTHYSAVLFKKIYGPNVEEQIHRSFALTTKEKYDCIILGNSRIYRGVDPDYLDLHAFNFGHDNDTFNQIYYKLAYLTEKGFNYRYLILGIDYFQFSILSDTRNYIYGDYFPEEYLNDYGKQDLNEKFNNFITYKYTNTFPVIVKYFLSDRQVKETNFLKDNGQFIVRNTEARPSDSVKRTTKRLSIQEIYFEKILDLAAKMNIKVILLMPPTRENELQNYTTKEISEFETFIESKQQKYNLHYLNYSRDNRFDLEDFSDVTHLSEVGSKKFTRILNNDLLRLLNSNIDANR